MTDPLKSLLFMTVISVAFLLFLNVISVNGETIGETYTPPPPDKSKLLPANDGGSDGCDSSRFACAMGGDAVIDKQTGLTWARDSELLEKPLPWQEAVAFCEAAEIGGQTGWRLPTRDEIITLLDTSQSRPALPEGHPFTKLKEIPSGEFVATFWTGTEPENDKDKAYAFTITVGRIFDSHKMFDYKIWPVKENN